MTKHVPWLLLLVACADEHNLGNTPATSFFGQTRWAITLGGTGEDRGLSVVVDPAGDVIAAGDFQGTVDFGTGPISALGSSRGGWISKRSGVDGSAKWVIPLGIDSNTQMSAAQLAATSDGSIVVAGWYAGDQTFGGVALQAPANDDRAFVAKLAPSGAVVWIQTLPTSSVFLRVAVSPTGRVAASGGFSGTIHAPNGDLVTTDMAGGTFAMVFDSDGSPLWATQLAPGELTGLALTVEDDLILTGRVDRTMTLGSVEIPALAYSTQFAARYDVAGELLWARMLGEPDVLREPGSLVTGPAGTFVTSSSQAELSTIDSLDPNGEALWTSTATGGMAQVGAAALAGRTIVTGGVIDGEDIDYGAGSIANCIFLVAHDQSGNYLGGTSLVERNSYCLTTMFSIAASQTGAIAFTGIVDRPADFGTGTRRFAGAYDAMIVMIDPL